jgi:hypothetical protein
VLRAPERAARNSEKTTIWRMSFSDIARTIDCGKMWAMNLARSKAERSTPLAASAGGMARASPTPGSSALTRIRPSPSETRLAQTNQPKALRPTRPSAVVSPIWAMPTTMVESTSGAMIILMRLRKTVVSIEK